MSKTVASRKGRKGQKTQCKSARPGVKRLRRDVVENAVSYSPKTNMFDTAIRALRARNQRVEVDH